MGEYVGASVTIYTDSADAEGLIRRMGLDPLGCRDGAWEAAGELNYGLAAIEDELAGARERGWAYFAQDDPKYDMEGTWVSWKPGWPAERYGSFMNGPIIGAAEVDAIEHRTADPGGRWALLRRALDPEQP